MIKPIMVYGSEVWILTEHSQSTLQHGKRKLCGEFLAYSFIMKSGVKKKKS
jgi:hypothetical protein